MKLFLVLWLFSIAFSVQAQDTLASVTVTGNRLNIPFKEDSRTVSIISAAQIQAMPAMSTYELLQYVAGVDIRRRAPHGIQADASIRGSSFEQVLILIDGIPLTDPQTGHHSLNLPITKENIQRIEVLKGPAARIYGANAFAGAINIVTLKAQKQSAAASFAAGSYGLRSGAVSVTSSGGWVASLSHRASDGYKYNTDYQLNNAFLRKDWQFQQAHLKFTGGATFRKFGANGFYASPQFKDQYEEIQTSFTALQLTAPAGKWTVMPRVFWRRNQDMYLFVRNKPELYRNMHNSHNFGLEINARRRQGIFTHGIGIIAQRQTLQSNNLGNRKRTIAGLFAEERIRLLDKRLDLIPGFSFQYYSDLGSRFLPGIDVGFQLNRHTRLFANAGLTWRTPSFTDLFYQSPTNAPNPRLKPETALSFEGGYKAFFEDWTLQIAAFRQMTNDAIDRIRYADTLPWQPVNIAHISAEGIETSINFQPRNQPFEFKINYTFLNQEYSLPEGLVPIQSRYLLNNIRHQANAYFRLQWFKNGTIALGYHYIDRVNMDDYNLLDAKISWQFQNFSIFAQADNLLDTKYTETNLVQMPGRWLSGGIRLKIE